MLKNLIGSRKIICLRGVMSSEYPTFTTVEVFVSPDVESVVEVVSTVRVCPTAPIDAPIDTNATNADFQNAFIVCPQ